MLPCYVLHSVSHASGKRTACLAQIVHHKSSNDCFSSPGLAIDYYDGGKDLVSRTQIRFPSSCLLFQWSRRHKIRFKGCKLVSCIHCLAKARSERGLSVNIWEHWIPEWKKIIWNRNCSNYRGAKVASALNCVKILFCLLPNSSPSAFPKSVALDSQSPMLCVLWVVFP